MGVGGDTLVESNFSSEEEQERIEDIRKRHGQIVKSKYSKKRKSEMLDQLMCNIIDDNII